MWKRIRLLRYVKTNCFSSPSLHSSITAFNISHHHMSACVSWQLVIIQTSPVHFRYIPGLISSLCLWCKSSGSWVVHTNTKTALYNYKAQLICALSARRFTNTVLFYMPHVETQMQLEEKKHISIQLRLWLYSKRSKSSLSENAGKVQHPLFELVQHPLFESLSLSTKKCVIKGRLTWTQSWTEIQLFSSPYLHLKSVNTSTMFVWVYIFALEEREHHKVVSVLAGNPLEMPEAQAKNLLSKLCQSLHGT